MFCESYGLLSQWCRFSFRTIIEYTKYRLYLRLPGIANNCIFLCSDKFIILSEWDYNALSANITPQGVKVPSPGEGFITTLAVKQGEYVSVGQTIAIISKNKKLQLRAEVPEKNFKYLKNITSANFKTSYDDIVYKLSELNGKLISYGKTAAPGTSYIPVVFEFDNNGDIIPGAFTAVYLLSSDKVNIISLPLSALTEEQGLYYVYVQVDDEGYMKKEVKTGENNGDRVEIISGLNPGDRVVTSGVYQVKLAGASGAIPHGHEH